MDHQLMDQHHVVLEQLLLYQEMHHHLNHSQWAVIEKTSVSNYSILSLIVFMLLFILLIYAIVYFINLVIVFFYKFLTFFWCH